MHPGPHCICGHFWSIVKKNPMLITRKVEFSASHTCWNPALDSAANEAVYGSEANPNGHGHNYRLEVALEGEPDPVTGMIVDLKEVKQVLEQVIVGPMDHRHLNREVPPFDKVVPTTENLAVEIWRRLQRGSSARRAGSNSSGCLRLTTSTWNTRDAEHAPGDAHPPLQVLRLAPSAYALAG
jgi:6-pyruvoyltetrahydropterin/6-carboxytetrahydropterin synthase